MVIQPTFVSGFFRQNARSLSELRNAIHEILSLVPLQSNATADLQNQIMHLPIWAWLEYNASLKMTMVVYIKACFKLEKGSDHIQNPLRV